MCGRFTLSANLDDLQGRFGFMARDLEYRPRYNIAPTQPVLVVIVDPQNGNRQAESMRWGLVPFWAKDPPHGFRLAEEAVAADRWVADGNYGQVRDIVWQRATCLIWLNYPFRVVFWRALRRTFTRVFTGQRVYSGNRESFRRAFLSSDSILWWVITTFRQRRREFPTLFGQHHFSFLKVIEFKSQRDADDFMRGLGK